MSAIRSCGCAVALLGLAGAARAQSRPEITAADYAAASGLLEMNLRGLVKNPTVDPHWIGDGGGFWYRRDEAVGVSYVRFDPRSRSKTPLFDHAALATALTAAVGPDLKATPTEFHLAGVAISGDLKTLTGTAAKKSVTCDLVALTCRAADPPPPGSGLLPSPDGKLAALIRDHNLVVRNVATGTETQLTSDGVALLSYGTATDGSLATIPARKSKLVPAPVGTTWSPNGRFLIVPRNDERAVAASPFVEWVPSTGARRPVLHEIRSALPGDRDRVGTDLFVLEPAVERRTPITLPGRYAGTGAAVVGWSVGKSQVFLLAGTPGAKSTALFRVDLASGDATTVVEESAPTRAESNSFLYNGPNVDVVNDGADAIWYSARSGWGHLYRYDAQTGALLNPITRGEWTVVDKIAFDERRREIYFTGGGREAGRDPYYRHLYKASIDGGEPKLLTDADADHQFDPPRSPFAVRFAAGASLSRVQPEAGVLLDTYSTVATPPVTVLRSTSDGHVIAEVERADASQLLAAGWRPPLREKVKAADGQTDLYAVYFAPTRDVGSSKHPVLDAEYGGPQVIVTPRNFVEAFSAGNPLGESGLARLGFAMVIVDGRGTPGRSNAFRDAGYPEFTQVGIDDHIATIRQLAERHAEMDLQRVGIYGWSWGGTFAAQAILSRPEFYRVAVSGAGAYDYSALYTGFETFIDLPQFADGSTNRGKPDDTPSNWMKLDVTRMAPNLKGHLLIIYGDVDENVPSSQAFRLVDALTRANKPYDLLYLPNRTHAGAGDAYTIRRTWDYFVEHLLGATPGPDVLVTIKPPPPTP